MKGAVILKLSIGKHRLTGLQCALILVGLLTLGATVIRTLALFLYLDADIGYFQSGKGLVIDLYIYEGLAVALAVALPFLIKKERVPAQRPLSTAGLVGAAAAAILLMVNAFYLLLRWKHLPAPVLLIIMTALFCALGAGYFTTQFRGGGDATVLCGYGMIFGCTCMLAMTYFDRYVQMNAPHKISSHLCMLAVMLAVLFEVRALLGKDLPHVRLSTLAIAFFFTVSAGLSNTLAFVAGIYGDLTYLFQDLICLALAVYLGARLLDLALTSADTDKGGEQA